MVLRMIMAITIHILVFALLPKLFIALVKKCTCIDTMKTLNKNKKYVFACYSDQLKLDFKQFCNMQGVKPDYVLRSMMYYFISNYANCVSVIREEKFIDHLYDSYPDLLEAPLLKRFSSSDFNLEEKI